MAYFYDRLRFLEPLLALLKHLFRIRLSSSQTRRRNYEVEAIGARGKGLSRPQEKEALPVRRLHQEIRSNV